MILPQTVGELVAELLRYPLETPVHLYDSDRCRHTGLEINKRELRIDSFYSEVEELFVEIS